MDVKLGLSYYERMSENRVLWRISGPKRNEITGGWKKLHIGQFHNSYSS
jgi:hypothetical protein